MAAGADSRSLTLSLVASLDPLAHAHAEPLAQAYVHFVFQSGAEHALDARPYLLGDDIERRGRVRVSRIEREPGVLLERESAQ